MTAPTTPRLSLRLPKRHFSLKSAFRTVRSFVPVKNIPSIENSPRSPTPENFQTSSSDLVRQVRFKMYEDFSLKAIERKFLARDIDRLSTSDALVLRILQEENGDVARAYQWLVNLLSWRRHFGVHKLPCESRNEMYETLSFVRGDQFSLLTCDAVKLHNAVGIHGLVPLIRQIVSIFEKIWNNGDTACLSLVISFAYMDPESWLKISTRHLLNELICGCAYYRYPGLCDKIVLVNWRSDEQSLELYDNILAKDWPFGVKKRVRFAQHDEVLKILAEPDSSLVSTDFCLQNALLLLCDRPSSPCNPVQTLEVDLCYRKQHGIPQQQDTDSGKRSPACATDRYVNVDVQVTDRLRSQSKTLSAGVETAVTSEGTACQPIPEDKICCLQPGSTEMFLHKLVIPRTRKQEKNTARNIQKTTCKEQVLVNRSTGMSRENLKEEHRAEVKEPATVKKLLKRTLSRVEVGQCPKKKVSFEETNITGSSSTETICPDRKSAVEKPVSEVEQLRRYPWDSLLRRNNPVSVPACEIPVRKDMTPAETVEIVSEKLDPSICELNQTKPEEANSLQAGSHEESEATTLASGTGSKNPSFPSQQTGSTETGTTSKVDQLKRYPWDTLCSREHPDDSLTQFKADELQLPDSQLHSQLVLPEAAPLINDTLAPEVHGISPALLEVGFPESRRYPSDGSRTLSVLLQGRDLNNEGYDPDEIHNEYPQSLEKENRNDDLTVADQSALNVQCVSPVAKEVVGDCHGVDALGRYPWDILNSRGKVSPALEKMLGNSDLNDGEGNRTVGFFHAHEVREKSHSEHEILQKSHIEHLGSGDGKGSSENCRFTLAISPPVQLICKSEALLKRNLAELSETSSPPARSLSCFNFCHLSHQLCTCEQKTADLHDNHQRSPATNLATLQKADAVDNDMYSRDKNSEAMVHSAYAELVEDSLRQADERVQHCLSSVQETGENLVSQRQEKSVEAADVLDVNRPPSPNLFRLDKATIESLELETTSASVISPTENKLAATAKLDDGPLFLPRYKSHPSVEEWVEPLHPKHEGSSTIATNLQTFVQPQRSTEKYHIVSRAESLWNTVAIMLLVSRLYRFGMQWHRGLQNRWRDRLLAVRQFLEWLSSALYHLLLFWWNRIAEYLTNLSQRRIPLPLILKYLRNNRALLAFMTFAAAKYVFHYALSTEPVPPNETFRVGQNSPRDFMARWAMGGFIRDGQPHRPEAAVLPIVQPVSEPVKEKSRLSFWELWLDSPPEKQPIGGPREILAFWTMGNIFHTLKFGLTEEVEEERRVVPQKSMGNTCSMLDVWCFVRSLRGNNVHS